MAGTYRTKAGDLWDVIARETYGSESYVSFLMANNQQHIHYFQFPEGIELEIKDLPEEEDTYLPDWRR